MKRIKSNNKIGPPPSIKLFKSWILGRKQKITCQSFFSRQWSFFLPGPPHLPPPLGENSWILVCRRHIIPHLHISIQANRVDPDQTLLHHEQSDLHSLSMRLLKHSQRQQMQMLLLLFSAVVDALMLIL